MKVQSPFKVQFKANHEAQQNVQNLIHRRELPAKIHTRLLFKALNCINIQRPHQFIQYSFGVRRKSTVLKCKVQSHCIFNRLCE